MVAIVRLLLDSVFAALGHERHLLRRRTRAGLIDAPGWFFEQAGQRVHCHPRPELVVRSWQARRNGLVDDQHVGAVTRVLEPRFGEVASLPTAWRVIAAITPERLGVCEKRVARRQARERACAEGAAPERITLGFDATLVTAHTEKEGRRATSRAGSGSIPWPATWTRATRRPRAGVIVESRGAQGGRKPRVREWCGRLRLAWRRRQRRGSDKTLFGNMAIPDYQTLMLPVLRVTTT
jgi:hypothetical protein